MNAPILATPAPTVGVEIAPDAVTAVSIAHRGPLPVVTAWATEPLPAGAVTAALNATNITDRAAVGAALGRAFGRLAAQPRRIALVIPDSVAKVSLVRFDKVPSRADDLAQLVRYQVRKTAPFRIEDAQVSYAPGAESTDGGREFVVTLARRDIVQEYEAVSSAAGAHAGLVDLATFNVINAVLAGQGPAGGDWLLVHVTPAYATLAIMRGGDLIFYRNRAEEAEGSLADLTHQTAMYYEDRLGGSGFARVLLVGGSAADREAGLRDGGLLRRTLEERLSARVELIDGARLASFADRISVDQATIDELAPIVGMLSRVWSA